MAASVYTICFLSNCFQVTGLLKKKLLGSYLQASSLQIGKLSQIVTQIILIRLHNYSLLIKICSYMLDEG